jgi:hypothetical protein
MLHDFIFQSTYMYCSYPILQVHGVGHVCEGDRTAFSPMSWGRCGLRYIYTETIQPRKIRLTEGNAKCRHLKFVHLYRDFAADVYLSEAQDPIPPPLTHCVCGYSILIHTGKGNGGGGGGLNQREGERGNSSRSWIENTNMTDCISSLKNLRNTRLKVPLQVNFFR